MNVFATVFLFVSLTLFNPTGLAQISVQSLGGNAFPPPPSDDIPIIAPLPPQKKQSPKRPAPPKNKKPDARGETTVKIPVPPDVKPPENPTDPTQPTEPPPAPMCNSDFDAELPSDYNPLDPANLLRIDLPKRRTGGSNQGQCYTDAGFDTQLDQLRQSLPNGSPRLTHEILFSDLNFWPQQNQISVSLFISEMGQTRHYGLVGYFNGFGQPMALNPTALPGRPYTGSLPVRGFVKCLDATFRCSLAAAHVYIGYPALQKEAVILYRSTPAPWKAHLAEYSEDPQQPIDEAPGDAPSNGDHRIISWFQQGRSTNPTPPNYGPSTLQTIYFGSFAILDGPSGAYINFIGRRGERLFVSSSLLAPEIGVQTDLPAQFQYYDNGSGVFLGSALQQIKLIQNSGLGQIKFEIRGSQQSQMGQELVEVIVMRPY